MRDRIRKAPAAVVVENLMKPRFERQAPLYFSYILDVHVAWTAMLVRAGLVKLEHAKAIYAAIADLRQQGVTALTPFDPAKEEIYFHIESYLLAKLGPEVAGNISLARTRPEPLARMVLRDRLIALLSELLSLRAQLLQLASVHVDTVMPGYTHMLHAQPTTFAHYLLAVHDTLARDTKRLLAAFDTVNQNTLGSAALAGTALPIDRPFVDRLLGFPAMVENTYDCVSSGDFLCEPAAAVAVLHTTISRVAMQFMIWHSSEFAMIEVADDYAVVSSLMPQKKNPSPLEHLRARSALITGNLMAVLDAHHNTCFEDVLDIFSDIGPLVCETVDLSSKMLAVFNGLLGGLSVNRALMLDRVRDGFSTASELAEMLVLRCGLSYRIAHNVVAEVVATCIADGKRAVDIDAARVRKCAREILKRDLDIEEEWVRAAIDPEQFVRAHDLPGGPAPAVVERMLQDRREKIDADSASLSERRRMLDDARAELQRLASQG